MRSLDLSKPTVFHQFSSVFAHFFTISNKKPPYFTIKPIKNHPKPPTRSPGSRFSPPALMIRSCDHHQIPSSPQSPPFSINSRPFSLIFPPFLIQNPSKPPKNPPKTTQKDLKSTEKPRLIRHPRDPQDVVFPPQPLCRRHDHMFLPVKLGHRVVVGNAHGVGSRGQVSVDNAVAGG
jgi:hypothetical protein